MAHNLGSVSELTADLSLLVQKLSQYPQIGCGTSSRVLKSVYTWVNPSTQQVVHTEVAIKQIRGEGMGQQEIEQRVKREIAVWRPLDHPNVTQFLGIVHLGERMPPCMVSPYLRRNDLLAYIERYPELKLAKAQEVAAGLKYLHSKMIVHGDLKVDNILVADNGVAQINDFDMSRILDIDGFSALTWRDARFNAPELITPGQANSMLPTFKSDVFSLGILFLQIFGCDGSRESELPYNHISRDGYDPEFSRCVRNGERPLRGKYRAMSDKHWALLCDCWKGNPSERPDITWVVGAL